MTRRRGMLLLAVLAASWLGGYFLHTEDVYLTPAYHVLIVSLLAVGLYGSTRDIDIVELRRNRRTVLLALSVGVAAKVAFISLVMLALYPHPASLVLGVAVAQIDPLAVAAAGRRSRMSASTRAVLNAWAAFDDPVTVLLTVYLAMFALRAGGIGSPAATLGSPALAFLTDLLLNLAFALAAYAAWRLARRLGVRAVGGVAGQVAVVVVVLAYAALGVAYSLMLGIALIGLFFRPFEAWRRTAAGIVFGALLVATTALGVVLAGTGGLLLDGALVKGVVLGVAAYVAQMVTGGLLARGRGRFDRLYLMLAQQNGLTAIVLALVLEPDFPGAVAVIAPAIVVTNVLHGAGGAVIRRMELRDKEPVPHAVAPVTEGTARTALFAEPARPEPGTVR